MSLWWRDRVRIIVAPDAVRLARISSAREGRVETVPVVQAAAKVYDSNANIIDALRQASQSAGVRKADAEVLLSSHLVRFLLMPWSKDLATDDEREAYARLEFEAIHGERARQWRIAMGDQIAGASALACAIDDAFLREMRDALAAAQMRVVSVAPHFASVFNRYRAKLSAKQCGFAFVESARVTIGWLQRGAWQAVSAPRISESLAQVLASELRQARTLGHISQDSSRMYVAFGEAHIALPQAIDGWEVVTLQAGRTSAAPDSLGRTVTLSEV